MSSKGSETPNTKDHEPLVLAPPVLQSLSNSACILDPAGATNMAYLLSELSSSSSPAFEARFAALAIDFIDDLVAHSMTPADFEEYEYAGPTWINFLDELTDSVDWTSQSTAVDVSAIFTSPVNTSARLDEGSLSFTSGQCMHSSRFARPRGRCLIPIVPPPNQKRLLLGSRSAMILPEMNAAVPNLNSHKTPGHLLYPRLHPLSTSRVRASQPSSRMWMALPSWAVEEDWKRVGQGRCVGGAACSGVFEGKSDSRLRRGLCVGEVGIGHDGEKYNGILGGQMVFYHFALPTFPSWKTTGPLGIPSSPNTFFASSSRLGSSKNTHSISPPKFLGRSSACTSSRSVDSGSVVRISILLRVTSSNQDY